MSNNYNKLYLEYLKDRYRSLDDIFTGIKHIDAIDHILNMDLESLKYNMYISMLTEINQGQITFLHDIIAEANYILRKQTNTKISQLENRCEELELLCAKHGLDTY